MNVDIHCLLRILPQLMTYLPITLFIALISIVLATLLGIVLAGLLRAPPLMAALAHVYVSFFRGTPLLVQLLIIYFGLPQLFPGLNTLSAISAVIIGLSLNSAAYLTEVFRAAIDSVDIGQWEASLASGLTGFQAARRILLPQACRNAIPAAGNIWIGLIKNSSLAFTLGVSELLAGGKIIATESMKFFEAYLAVGLVYWGLIIVLSALQRLLERAVGKPYTT